MGEFDDVLAMEPGDEWDDYDPNAGPANPADDRPLVAELALPGVVVQVRGDVPPEVVERLAPLAVDPGAAAADPALVTLSVEQAGPGHRVTDHDRDEEAVVDGPDQLVDAVVARLVDAAASVPGRGVLVRAAALELADGRGVLLLDDDDDGRHHLVAACVAAGARYLGADHVVVRAGSRTVLAVPTPLRAGLPPVDRATVAAATTVSLIVVLDRTPGRTDPPFVLGGPYGCARLALDALSAGQDGQDAVRVAAMLAGGAAVWSVPVAGEPADVVAQLSALTSPDEEDLVVVRRPMPSVPGLLVVRFPHGGVVADVDAELVFELAEDELATVDALRWPVVATDPERDAEVAAQLAALGVDLAPVVAAGMVTAPGPASYGLADSPVGRASRALWDRAAVDRVVADDPRVAPVLGHAARRGDLDVDEELAAQLVGAAAQATARTRTVDEVVDKVLEAVGAAGIEPLLLGEVVAAHDGPLPGDMIAPEHVELLVAHHEVQACADALVAAGATPVGDTAPPSTTGDAADADEGTAHGSGATSPRSPRTLRFGRDDVTVVVHDRLAAGPFGELVDHDDLLDRSVPFRLGRRWVASLHPDDRFVHACVRLAGPAPAGLHDLRQVVLTAPVSRAGMAAALEASARWGATRTVLSAIREVDAVLPGLSPWLVERATRQAAPPERRRRRPGRRR